jgi:hypothetical protein
MALVAKIFPQSAINFALYEDTKDLILHLKAPGQGLNQLDRIAAGCAAGGLSCAPLAAPSRQIGRPPSRHTRMPCMPGCIDGTSFWSAAMIHFEHRACFAAIPELVKD